MKPEWIEPYQANITFNNPKKDFFGYMVPHYVSLPGNTSCSLELGVALKFAFENPKPEHVPTVFIFSAQNYGRPAGIRLNCEAYTAYPSEGEVLLMEGKRVQVLKVVRDFVIDNSHPSFKSINGRTVNIVHLFIADY